MPGGIQPDVISGSVNTQMWDNIQSALTVKFHSHPRVQAPDFAPLKKRRHISESLQCKRSGRLSDDFVWCGSRVPVICSITLPVIAHAIDVSSIYLQKLHWVKIQNRSI
jgi:hypothetical protein